MKSIMTKEIYIYKYDNPNPKTVWKQTYRILKLSKYSIYNEAQVIVSFYNMHGYCGMWILDRRNREAELLINNDEITIVGNFRGWKK